MAELIHKASERGANWVATVHDHCQWCGHDWHKHELWCPAYHSIAPKRCAVAHTLFTRSIDPISRPESERYEYECRLCNMPPVFSAKITHRDHPMCVGVGAVRHYWTTCGDGCCKPWCNGCGVEGTWENLKKQYLEEQ